MMKKILVPIDGSDISLRAMNFAIELGKHFASEIVVLNVDIPYDLSRIKPAVKDKDGNEIESARLTPLELAQREAGKSGYDKITFKKYVDIDPAEKSAKWQRPLTRTSSSWAIAEWASLPDSSWAVSAQRFPKVPIVR